MSQTDGIMDEPPSHPGFGNFSDLYLGMSYVGYQLEKYTVDGVKKIHAAGSLKTSSKCISRCSLQFGRDLEKWCSLCEHWRNHLSRYLHSDGVAWERMKSWKWPDSYSNIIEVFVPTICSVNTPFLQDLYVQSFIWANCNAFRINPSTLNGLRDVRNAIVHNSTTCISSTQMETCFGVLQTLLCDPDVDNYLNSFECKEHLNSIQYKQNLKNSDQAKRICSDVYLTANPQYETDTKGKNSKQRKGIYEKFQDHQNVTNRMFIIRSYPVALPSIKELLLWFTLGMSSVYAVYTLRSEILRLSIDMEFVVNIFIISMIFLALCSMLRVCPRQDPIKDQVASTKPEHERIPPPLGPYDGNIVSSEPDFDRKVPHWHGPSLQRRSNPLERREPKYFGQLSESKFPRKDNIHAVTHRGDWDRCLNSEDVALLIDLINQDIYPDRGQLDRTCEIFSQSSMIIDLITDKICKRIKQKYAEGVQRVWAAYEHYCKNHIVFVIITKENVANANIELKEGYDLRFRKENDFNSESKQVIFEENAQDLFPEEDDIIKVQNCIKENTSKLMKSHSNLTLMSASLLKCRGYGTGICKTERKTCIVLHVHVKGLIPLNEVLFPKHMGGIDIDVREGCLLLNTGNGPHEKHPNVKMGCGIKAKDQDACGTLGGFIEHQKYGLCALTCAHVIFDDIEHLKNQRKEFENKHVECLQPCFEDALERSRFGTLKLTVLRDGTTDGLVGLDYALIAVEENRAPLDGSFPLAKIEELNGAGFDDTPSFETGKVIDFKKLKGKRHQCSVVKYGSTTILTCGMIKWLYPTLNFTDQLSGITLLNQIQINFTKTQGKDSFSAGGDSGALVFKVDDDNKLTAVGLLVAGNAKLGFSVATPICDILADIGVQRFKTFSEEQFCHLL